MTTLAANPTTPGVRADAGLGVARWSAALGLVVAAALASRGAWASLASQAVGDGEASHVLLVPVILVWLVWLRRRRLALLTPRHLWVGPVVAAVGAALHVYGAEDYRFYTWQAGSVLMVVGALLSATGTEVVRRFAPAFLVLAFVVPMPRPLAMALTVPMMTGGAVATEAILQAGGADVTRAGNLLSLNGVEVTVEEACSGMRGVWGLTLVAVVFAFVTPLRTWVRAAVLLCAPLLALACNVLRLVPTVWMYGNRSDATAHAFHDVAGWAVLFVGYALLTGIVRLLEYLGVAVNRPRSGTGRAP